MTEDEFNAMKKHNSEIAGLATKGRKAYIEVSTGKRKMFKPDEIIDLTRYMKFSDWVKIHPKVE